MKNSDISFQIELDRNNFPEKIKWKASDAENILQETKAISINVWDQNHQNTLRIDLWVKDMRVDEMKKFWIDCLGGMAQSILNATGDTYMSNEINSLCEKLVRHVEKELKSDTKS